MHVSYSNLVPNLHPYIKKTKDPGDEVAMKGQARKVSKSKRKHDKNSRSPVGKNLFKVSTITLKKQRSLNIVLTLLCFEQVFVHWVATFNQNLPGSKNLFKVSTLTLTLF